MHLYYGKNKIQFTVVISNESSDKMPITFGVPQGSTGFHVGAIYVQLPVITAHNRREKIASVSQAVKIFPAHNRRGLLCPVDDERITLVGSLQVR